METDNKEGQKMRLLMTANLTDEDLKIALLQYLIKNEEVNEALSGKTVSVIPEWQVTKWSDPDVFVRVNVVENISEESTEEGSSEG